MGAVESIKTAVLHMGVRGFLGFERLTSGAVYDPTPRGLEDPYPMYARLRAHDPIHRSRLIGCWIASRYVDVLDVLRDARFSADERNLPDFGKIRARLIRNGVIEEGEPDAPMMLRTDPPDHTRLRTLVNKAFTPRSIRALQVRIHELVAELLDAAVERGELDIMRDLAEPLPMIVISEMLGVPAEDRARFKHWSTEVVRNLGPSSMEDARASAQASRELRAYFESLALERRRSPKDDLFSALLQAEEEGDRLTWDEVVGTLILLLVAGNETTSNLIGNGSLALLQHPEQLEALHRDPGLLDAAIEEMLRYDSPVQATSRIVTEDLEIGGRELRRGAEVILLIGAANRDAEQFAEPDRFDIRRTPNRHVSFGNGAHFCLGSNLARSEARAAIGALVERFPNMKLAADPVERRHNAILRGAVSIPVRF